MSGPLSTPPATAVAAPAGRARGAARALFRLLNRPLPITTFSLVVGWAGIALSYRGHWLGGACALVTTVGALLAVRRGRVLARERERSMVQAVADASARNRELELLRRLGSSLLTARSSGELLEDAAALAAELLRAHGSAVVLVVEEGRFLRVVAGAGVLRPATGSLLPMDRSLCGWTIGHDQPLISDDMERDPRNHPVDTLPPTLARAVCVPLRASSVVIGAACAYNLAEGRAFDEHDVHLLTALSDQLAVGLDRSSMLEESRRNERELAAKNRELVRATRLRDQFLANMSHELRTPLNAIIGFSDLLQTPEYGPVGERQKDFLESITRNSQHLLGLINSVLDLSKIAAGRMTMDLARLDIGDAIDGAVTDTSSLRAARRQRVAVEPLEEPLRIVADHLRIRQILYNLLSNASKFSAGESTITVRAGRIAASLPVADALAPDGFRLVAREAVRVAVHDTGIGIAPEDMPRLFQAFSQVDSSASRESQGTGLGLALCRQLVELHGGRIGAESAPGQGSTFWFELPVDGPAAQPQ